MGAPLISIILPTYNVEEYVARCLDSCLAQSNQDFELIFVDDCGQDGSMAIIERYAALNAKVRIVRNKENQGTFISRRNGAFVANGDYIFYVDPDDEISADAIYKIKKSIEISSADMIISGITCVPSPKLYSRRSILPESCEFPNVMKEIFLSRATVAWGTPGKIYSRKLLIKAYEKLSCVKERLVYGEDALLFYVCASFSEKVMVLHDAIYKYYINPGSITVSSLFQVSYKSDQLCRIIDILSSLASDADLMSQRDSKKSLLRIVDLVRRDKIFMERRGGDFPGYVRGMLACYAIDRDPRFLVRALLSICSFGFFRL